MDSLWSSIPLIGRLSWVDEWTDKSGGPQPSADSKAPGSGSGSDWGSTAPLDPSLCPSCAAPAHDSPFYAAHDPAPAYDSVPFSSSHCPSYAHPPSPSHSPSHSPSPAQPPRPDPDRLASELAAASAQLAAARRVLHRERHARVPGVAMLAAARVDAACERYEAAAGGVIAAQREVIARLQAGRAVREVEARERAVEERERRVRRREEVEVVEGARARDMLARMA